MMSARMTPMASFGEFGSTEAKKSEEGVQSITEKTF